MEEDFQNAMKCLKSGGVILYPTDTVWGLGCDATDEEAIAKIYSIKERSDSKSMLVLVGDMEMLEKVAGPVDEKIIHILENNPEPVTIIYPQVRGISSKLKSTDGSTGVRLCQYAFVSRLCRELGRPIVSTSANISNKPTPRSFSEIEDNIIEKADYICTTGRNQPEAEPSTILKIDNNGQIIKIR